jgi:hypothetical protein
MSVDSAEVTPSDVGAAYCRGCGYALRGLAAGGGRCPECGRAFDLADRRTVARRPPRLRLRRWAWRAVVIALVVVTVAGAGVGWLWQDWRGEQAAVAQLRAAGARVNVLPIGPGWLRRHWPVRWTYLFDRADQVELWDDFELDAADVDWPTLRHLRVFKSIRCRVGGPVVARLRGLKHLETVFLNGSPLDPPGHAALAGMPTLTDLCLMATGTTDADVAALRGLRRLRELTLAGNDVGDPCIAHLAGLGDLATLSLSNTLVTDAGLATLHRFPSLREVNVRGTAVTADGVGRLRAALPNTHVKAHIR